MAARSVTSAADLKAGIDSLKMDLCQPETEHSWDTISRSIKSLTVLSHNGACDFPEDFVQVLRSVSRPLTNSMVSERTRLSGAAIDLISSVASGLGLSFEPLLSVFLPVLLSLCGRTNKVIITRARACINVIIETTQLPSILPYFLQSIKDKSASLRLAAAEGTLTCLNCFNPPDLEKDARARDIEAIIRSTATDAQADIRAVSRKIFDAYKVLLPSRVESFTAPLTPTIKKYLDIKIPNVRSQRSLLQLTSKAEATNTTSLSTSVISTQRQSQRPEGHARSTSSSNISSGGHVHTLAKKPLQHIPPKKTGSDMPPPQYVPIRPTQQSNRAKSQIVDDRKPTLSTSAPLVVRSGAQTTQSTLPSAFPARPTSANSLSAPHRSLQLVSTISNERSNGPRRVPIQDSASESNQRERVNSAIARPESSTVQSLPSGFKGIKSSAHHTPLIVSEKMKASTKIGDSSSSVASSSSSVRAPPGKVPRPGGIMQPTLSQLSRVKATAKDKIRATTTSKVIKGRPLPPKGNSSTKFMTSRQAVPGEKVRPISQPVSSDKGSITPAQTPLPLSPTSTLTNLPSDEQEVESFGPALLLTPVEPPTDEDEEMQSNHHLSTTSADVADGKVFCNPAEDFNLPQNLAEQDTGILRNGASVDRTGTISRHLPVAGADVADGKVFDNPVKDTNLPENLAEQDAGISHSCLSDKPQDDHSSFETYEVAEMIPDQSELPNSGVSVETRTPPTSLLSGHVTESSTKTPISALLSSIERGFLFSPSSPLSPPQSYLNQDPKRIDLPISFPQHENSNSRECARPTHSKGSFFFGVGIKDVDRPALESVKNLDI